MMIKQDFERLLELRDIDEDNPLYLYVNDDFFKKSNLCVITQNPLDARALPLSVHISELSREPKYSKNPFIPNLVYSITDVGSGQTITGSLDDVFKTVVNYSYDFSSEDIKKFMETVYQAKEKSKGDTLYNIIKGREETEGLDLYQIKNDLILNNKIFFDERQWGEGTNLNIFYEERDKTVIVNISGDFVNTVALDRDTFLDMSEKNFVNFINQVRFFAQEAEIEDEMEFQNE